MMIDRVRVQFTGGYATQRGPRFCRGDVAALLPDEAEDVLRRQLGIAAPPVHVVSPEEVRMAAYAQPPAHTQIVAPDVAKQPGRRHFYKGRR